MDGQPTPARAPRRWLAHAGHGRPTMRPHASSTLPTHRFRGSTALSNAARPITLDGSAGEGGGQILRTALSLALVTGRPFRIVKIRANREKPGLRAQHLKAVEAAAALCGGEAIGAHVGSRELTFRPAPFVPRDLRVDIGTAGATALVLHTLALPIALRAEGPVHLSLLGGTFNEGGPSFPFLDETWRRHMAALGLPVVLSCPAAGFYPQGGGRLDAWIEPADLRPLTLADRGPLAGFRGVAGVARLPRSIAERMRERALLRLADHGLDADIALVDWPATASRGTALALTADHGGVPATFVGLGKLGKPAEVVADEAVDELLAYEASNGALDPHSADQILLPLALAEGSSVYSVAEVTEHLRTNIATIGAFLDRAIRIEEPADGPARVVVE